ncbi:MAG: ATP-binding cassette domain-containing protein, partial [bacterium]
KIGTRKTADTSLAEMARMMVGREVLLSVMRTPREPGKPALSVRDLSLVGDRKRHSLHGITFDVRSGEVLGVAGVEGNGQTELIEVIAGLVPPSEGEIRLKGRPITTDSPARRLAEGLAHIPPDRRKQGLILSFSVRDNLVLGRHREKRFRRWLDLKHKEVRSFAHSCIEAQDIRPRDPHVQVSKLSGGNQQKVILARELSRGAAFIIAAHPTRGVDIGAIETIHRQILDQREQGCAILLVSADLSEILSLSDRIAVLYEGRFVAVLDSREATEEKLGLLMAGAKSESADVRTGQP